MPIYAILFVIVLVITKSGTVAVVGALGFVLIAAVGTAVVRPDPTQGRQRNRSRKRRA